MNPYIEAKRRYLKLITAWLVRTYGQSVKTEIRQVDHTPLDLRELHHLVEMLEALDRARVTAPLFLRMLAEGALNLDHASITLRLTILNYRAFLKVNSTDVEVIVN